MEDEAYIESLPDLKVLLTRKWSHTIYNKTYRKLSAAELATLIFTKKNSDDKCFTEVLAEYMQNNDDKIK